MPRRKPHDKIEVDCSSCGRRCLDWTIFNLISGSDSSTPGKTSIDLLFVCYGCVSEARATGKLRVKLPPSTPTAAGES
jgi:hypothetical protein